MRMLAIDTTTRLCTIAAGPEEAMSEVVHPERRDLACRLATWTAEALAAAGLRAEDVELVAVGRGPGSWTGLRIGLSFARAFAWARGVRCIGVPSADATALALAPSACDRFVYAMPANARQLVIAEFAVDREGISKIQAEHNVAVDELVRQLAEDSAPTLVGGEGAARLRDELARRSSSHAHVHLVEQAVTAKFIADYARRLSATGDATRYDVSPIYAAPSAAEINSGTIVTS